uniref:Secreted protein n=1 Tax=Peronospora matthiolae TaxID=2874970 RepID=A0AAV1V574_9STRA
MFLCFVWSVRLSLPCGNGPPIAKVSFAPVQTTDGPEELRLRLITTTASRDSYAILDVVQTLAGSELAHRVRNGLPRLNWPLPPLCTVLLGRDVRNLMGHSDRLKRHRCVNDVSRFLVAISPRSFRKRSTYARCSPPPWLHNNASISYCLQCRKA